MNAVTRGELQGFLGMGLAPRELDFTLAVATGMTDKEIAKLFGLSPASVSKRLDVAKFKLGCTKRAHLVAQAMKRGIIAPLAILLMVCSVTNGAVPDMERAPRGRVKITRTVRNSRRDDLLDNIFDYV